MKDRRIITGGIGEKLVCIELLKREIKLVGEEKHGRRSNDS